MLIVFGSVPAEAWEIPQILERVEQVEDMTERTLAISELLLGVPYVGGNCGEGERGCYDRDPLFRLDQFDCTTYIETVMALAFVPAHDTRPEESFLYHLKNIRYVDGEDVSFVNRNHFTELNWVPDMVRKNYVKDITLEISPGAPTMRRWVDVGVWYENKIAKLTPSEDMLEIIEELSRSSVNKNIDHLAELAYVPLKHLLSFQDVRDRLKQKKVVIFNLVKHLHKEYSADRTIVSHQGFIVEKNGVLYLRHATPASAHRKTVDMSMDEYVRERMKDTTWPTLGMNILEIQDARP